MADFLGLTEDELQLFLDETGEHLDTLETELLDLERDGADPDLVARVFRAAHTIKGASATAGLGGMAHITHVMETLFDKMRAGTLEPTIDVMTPILTAVDLLREMLGAVEARNMPEEPPHELLQAMEQAASGGLVPVQRAPAAGAVSGGPVGSMMVQVNLTPDSMMPAVRALQVLLALESQGDVLASQPTQAEIESEQVGQTIVVWLDTDRDVETVRAALDGVPDVLEIQIEQAEETEPDEAPVPSATSPSAPQQAKPAEAAPGADRRGAPAPRSEDRTIRVDVSVLDDLMNLVGELVIDRGRLAGLGQTLAERAGTQDVGEELGRVTGHLTRVTGMLQEAVLRARMLPIERVFRKFPRMVRDLTHQMGKQIEFSMSGEDTELDRSVMEMIGDPLMHLVRNALDHGLENPQDRIKAGKSPVGSLRLMAAHEENHVVIRVQDDGRGIDANRIKESAVRKGLLTPERARELSEQDAYQLLFSSGFSTAEQVTDVSGRGVGLDVVRRNIEQFGGRIEVESRVGMGTTFRLLLPLTLATIRALLVQVDNETLALPLSTVAETLRVAPEEITSIKGRWVTRVRGRVVPMLWLEQFVKPGYRPSRGTEPVLAVLVMHQGDLVGLVVDGLLGEQEVVVKGIGSFFGQVRGVSGATILGDGSLSLIVDIGGLIAVLSAEANAAAASMAGHTA